VGSSLSYGYRQTDDFKLINSGIIDIGIYELISPIDYRNTHKIIFNYKINKLYSEYIEIYDLDEIHEAMFPNTKLYFYNFESFYQRNYDGTYKIIHQKYFSQKWLDYLKYSKILQ
jgi:hypothetical protein